MNISPINNNQNTNTSFGKLKKITCSNFCNRSERRVKLELQNLALCHDFFKTSDVNAFINVRRNIAELKFNYKPIAKTIMGKLRNLFVFEKELTIANYHNCPDEGMFLLVKKLRQADKFEDLIDSVNK